MRFVLKFVMTSIVVLLALLIPLSFWLKTDSGKEKITNIIKTVVLDELGLNIDIENLDISLPIRISADNLSLGDIDGKFIDIKNFHINIVPSLFSLWEITIWAISADEIRLFKEPKLNFSKTSSSSQSLFNPNIILKGIDFPSIILDPKFTGSNKDIVLSIDSQISLKAKKQLINFVLVGKLVSPDVSGFSDNLLELVGKYDIKNEALNLESIKLNSKLLSIDGNLYADSALDKISGVINYKINHLDELINDAVSNDSIKVIKGNLFGQIKLAGSVNSVQIKQSGKLDLQIGENEYFNYYPLSWETDLIVKSGNIDGTINFEQGGIKAKGNIGYRNGELYLKQMRAEAPDFLKTADLVFDTKNMILTGSSTVVDKNLRETSKYFPFLTSGAIDLKFEYFSNDKKSQSLKAKGKIKQLSTKFGSYGFIDLDLNINDLWAAKLDDSNLKVRSLTYNNIMLNELILSVKSVLNGMFLKGSVSSSQPYPFNFKFSSALEHDKKNQKTIARITDFSGVAREVPFEKGEDILIEIGKESIVKIPALKIDKGQIDLDSRLGANQVVANLNISKIPVKALPNILSNAFKDSVLDGKIILSGAVDKPQLLINLDLSGIKHDPEGKTLSMKIDGNYAQNKLIMNSKLLSQDRDISQFDLNLPLKLSFSPFNFIVHKDKKFSANVFLIDNLDFMSLIPLPVGHQASGKLKGDFAISGTVDQPSISGKALLSTGFYKYKGYGVNLRNITSEIVASGTNLLFKNFSAEDDYTDKVNGSGNIDLKGENRFTFNVQTEKFNPINTSYLQGEVKGYLDILGDNKEAKAKGEFELGPLEIKIPEHFRRNIPELNISKVIDGNQVVEKDKSIPYALNLDIKVKADNKVYVRGWGVDTLLKGNLHIKGLASNPIITGILRSERGRYQEFGKLLNVKEGVLNFDGPISPSPYLRIVGATIVGSTEISLVLSGSILNPDISIESNPSISEEEALSKLLFGDGVESISTFQALQLADGMRRLSGHGGGFDPLSIGRKILGVDDINFKTNEEDPTKSSVGVGKHLSDKVYFEIESGRHENSTKTKIEVQLTPKISIENIFEPEGNTSVGINWRFDY
jgi:hypothetical protein